MVGPTSPINSLNVRIGLMPMVMDTQHLAPIAPRLLPALSYLMSRSGGQQPDTEGYITVACPMDEMSHSLRTSRRALMGHMRELELTKDVIRESVSGHVNRYRVRIRKNESD